MPDQPTTAARCSVCGDEIHEDRQVVTRIFKDGRLVGIRHDQCKPAARPTRWYCNQRIRHTGSLDLGNVIAVDFEEDLVQISDGRWWRMEHVIEVSSGPEAQTSRGASLP